MLKQAIKNILKHWYYGIFIWGAMLPFLIGLNVLLRETSPEINDFILSWALLSNFEKVYTYLGTTLALTILFVPYMIVFEYQDLKHRQVIVNHLKAWFTGHVAISKLPLLNGMFKSIFDNSITKGHYSRLHLSLVTAIYYTKTEEYDLMNWFKHFKLKLEVLRTLNTLKQMLRIMNEYDLKANSLGWNNG